MKTLKAYSMVAVWIVGFVALPIQVRAEETTTTFNAFSVWNASTEMIQTSANGGMAVGTLRGPLYVETKEGPVKTGNIACPFTFAINLDDSRQAGHGQCVFTAADGAKAFASFKCSGFHLVGCSGEFKIDGGTGRLENASGTGPVIFRGNKWLIAADGDGEAGEIAEGIAIWRAFSITVAPSS